MKVIMWLRTVVTKMDLSEFFESISVVFSFVTIEVYDDGGISHCTLCFHFYLRMYLEKVTNLH